MREAHKTPSNAAPLATRADYATWRRDWEPHQLGPAHVDALSKVFECMRPLAGWRAVANALLLPFTGGRGAELQDAVRSVAHSHPELIVSARVRDVAGMGWICTVRLATVGADVHLEGDGFQSYEALTRLMHGAGDQNITIAGEMPRWVIQASPPPAANVEDRTRRGQ